MKHSHVPRNYIKNQSEMPRIDGRLRFFSLH